MLFVAAGRSTDDTKNEARKQLDIVSGLWHSLKSNLKKHMHKSYKIDPACATARHGTSI
jgi:hypothetical protein